jgi:hypothetical protein
MYRIECNDEQVRVIIAALDAYSRLHMGQLEKVADILSDGYFTTEQLEDARAVCKDLKTKCGFLPNSSYGIYNEKVPLQGKIAWDICCVVRQTVAKAENHRPYSAWFQDPAHIVKDIPLAVCHHEE